MVEINEKDILSLEIRKGINLADEKFRESNINVLNDDDLYYLYNDITWQIIVSVMYYWERDNIIDIIYLANKNIDVNLLNGILNQIKKETYMYGLRIIKDSNNDFLYLYVDKVYNDEIYYVDDKLEKEKVRKSLGCKPYEGIVG